MKIALIDNYDSFTYNLVHLIEKVSDHIPIVIRNDEVVLSNLEQFDLIILSPGPGIPSEAGLLLDIIKNYALKKPMFGVCLGLQAIVEVFGGNLENLETVYHGVSTEIKVIDKNSVIFKDLKTTFKVGRYHSWIASNATFPNSFNITAVGDNNIIMAIEHKKLPIYAVQFHPESILTPDGEQMLKNVIQKVFN